MTTTTRSIGKQTHKLSPEHKVLLQGWFLEGLSTAGIRSRIELYNQQAAQVNAPLFPSLHVDSIGYWRKQMAERVNYIVNEGYQSEQLMNRQGLRHKEERLKRLEWAAEVLEPYIGQASIKGIFSASEQYCAILEQIRSEVEPKGSVVGSLDPAVVRSMSIEQVRELAEEFRKGA